MTHELIAQYGLTALTWLLAGLTTVAMKYGISKIDSDRIRGYTERLFAEVKAAVFEVGQTYVEALKEGREDGKLTELEKREAKKRAIAIAKSNLGTKGAKALARVLDVDEWIGNKVEAVLGGEKAAKKP